MGRSGFKKFVDDDNVSFNYGKNIFYINCPLMLNENFNLGILIRTLQMVNKKI